MYASHLSVTSAFRELTNWQAASFQINGAGGCFFPRSKSYINRQITDHQHFANVLAAKTSLRILPIIYYEIRKFLKIHQGREHVEDVTC
mmetsp:Transcript_49998/g.97865  ORF Transcript_49998/g.97865 Transcript_49998/m.97865 type:complete len:89 (+) Transcript_49998:96-362(+)